MVKLKDIAVAAGVTVSVVSRALSANPDKHARVAPETKEKILATARSLGYEPNRQAEFLKRGQSATIGVFIPEVANRLVADLMFGICRRAAAEGFPLSFFFGRDADIYRSFIRGARNQGSSGIITYPLSPELESEIRADLADYRGHGGNLVIICAENEHGDIPVVRIDNFRGGELAGDHLAARCGVVFVEGASSYTNRIEGCLAALRAHGTPQVVRYSPEDFAAKFAAAAANPAATLGVFATTDALALRLTPMIAAAGRTIHQDAFLVGYDNLYLTDLVNPPLTTIHQPFKEVGELAVAKLINIIYRKPETGAAIAPWLVDRGGKKEQMNR